MNSQRNDWIKGKLSMHVKFIIFPHFNSCFDLPVTASPDCVQLEGIHSNLSFWGQARLKFLSFLCSLNYSRIYYANAECEKATGEHLFFFKHLRYKYLFQC